MVVGLLGSCFLSFSHLVPVSSDDDLADWSLFLGLSTLAPLLEQVASLFLAGKLDPSKAAGSDFLQVSLGYLDLSSLFLDPGGRSNPGPFVCEDDSRREFVVGFSGIVFLK